MKNMASIISFLGDQPAPMLRKEVEDILGKEAVASGIKSGFVKQSKSGKLNLTKKGMDRHIGIMGSRTMRNFLGL